MSRGVFLSLTFKCCNVSRTPLRPQNITGNEWYESFPELVNTLLITLAIATVKLWNTPFRGEAADVLLMTISGYLNKQRSVYARYSTIINSSGTGKSRMVDQVSTKIITIPMCLRGEGTKGLIFHPRSLLCILIFLSSKGFPPADSVLRNWLHQARGPENQNVVAKKLRGFLASLFSVTAKQLKVLQAELLSHGAAHMPELPKLTKEGFNKLPDSERDELVSLLKARQEILAAAFRDCMTRGQSFEDPNEYRRKFFQEVVDAADKVSF
jgi:hypothetical protein